MKDNQIKEAWNSPYPTMPDEKVDKAWREFRKSLNVRERKSRPRWEYVASLLVLVGVSCYFTLTYNPKIRVQNLAHLDKEIWLPDGSTVLLKEGSEISYRKQFDDERLVELKGQAFFNVVKDSLSGFKVKTRFTTTTALGTSFLVTEKPFVKDTEIALYSGRVLVSVKDIAGSWGLVEGEKFIFENGKAYVKVLNSNPSLDNDSYHDLNNIALEDVYDYLEDKYGYRFVSKASHKDRRVTFRISGRDSLENVLKVLSIINNSAYELNEKSKVVEVHEK